MSRKFKITMLAVKAKGGTLGSVPRGEKNMKIFTGFLIGALFSLSIISIAQAGVKFIPKDGKLWVKATGELSVLKSTDAKQEQFVLKLEDGSLFILTGKQSVGLKKFVGKKIELDGLLRKNIDFEKKLIPSIEVIKIKLIESATAKKGDSALKEE